MFHSRRRFHRALTAAGAAALLLTANACGSSDEVGEDGEVTVSMWYTFPQPFGPSMEELKTICEARLPGITLAPEAVGADYAELDQRVQAAIAAGDPPDISMQGLEKTELLATSPAVVDLSEIIDGDSDFDIGPVEPFLQLARGANGKQVGIPWGTSVPVLYWNKEHFQAAGLDPEAPPTTLEELLEFADELKNPEQGRVGVAFDYQLPNNYVVPAILAQSGASMVDNGQLALASDRAKQVLQTLADSASTGAVGTYPDYAAIANAFKTEQASMMIFASTTGPAWAGEMTSEFGTARIPQGFGHNGEYQIFAAGNMWTLHASDERTQQAAWQMLKCFLSPEGAAVATLKNGYLPTNPQAVSSDEVAALLQAEPFRQASIDVIPDMEKLFAFGGNDGRRAAEIYRDAWVIALNGEMSASDALDQALEEITKLSDVTY